MAIEALPKYSIEQIAKGEAVLFLGAGAARGAVGPAGEVALSGTQLRDKIAAHFSIQKKDRPLWRVAELAENVSSLYDLQSFVAGLLDPLQPAAFHQTIARFKWRALFTTNYDLVVERAYEKTPDRVQTLKPIIRDGDSFERVLYNPDAVPYFKLHGSILCINDKGLPLILTSEQYARYLANRGRLFFHLKEKARECPVIFCGYSISDPNIIPHFFAIDDTSISRQRYISVDPSADDDDKRYWASRNVDVLNITCEQFFEELEALIPKEKRILGAITPKTQTSISRWNKTHTSPSSALIDYLDGELQHVYTQIADTPTPSRDFYRGFSTSWYAFASNYDVGRDTAAAMLGDILLGADKPGSEVFLLKGYAGGGVTTSMMRIAWDLSEKGKKLVFYLKEDGKLRGELLEEILALTGEKIVVVIDDAQLREADIGTVIKAFKQRNLNTVFVLGSRINEWNIFAENLDQLVDYDYEQLDLGYNEAKRLVEKLAETKCLGYLQELSKDDQIAELLRPHARQLLVALNEIMSNHDSFEEIVTDEYQKIVPPEAQLLYLDICTLNRFRVPVRAGLVSRLSGIRFEDFRNKFFKPLEHVVRTDYDRVLRDHVYRTRHPMIAEAVFLNALRSERERAERISRIVANLNLDYEVDAKPFGELIKGRTLSRDFNDKRLVDAIYQSAKSAGADQSFVLHQQAIFEMHHRDGSLRQALRLIDEASAARDRTSPAILHTKAEILRRLALTETNVALRDRQRNEAVQILSKQLANSYDSRPYQTFANLRIDMAAEILSGKESEAENSEQVQLSEQAVYEWVSEAEDKIRGGLARFPDDEYLLTCQTRLAQLLDDEPRALRILERIVARNPGSISAVLKLADYYDRKGNTERADSILNGALKERPADKILHLKMAQYLVARDEKGLSDKVDYHLRHAYTKGDANHFAAFIHARHHYLYGDRKHAKALFAHLKSAHLSPELKNKPRYPFRNNKGDVVALTGVIDSYGGGYCFIYAAEMADSIYSNPSHFIGRYDQFRKGDTVKFQLAFNYKGPVCLQIEKS